MPYRETPRIVWWRVLLTVVLFYVAIRIMVPGMIALGIPFEVRALALALLPVIGFVVGQRWFLRREAR